MKNFILTILLVIPFLSINAQNKSEIEKQLDAYVAEHLQSPLPQELLEGLLKEKAGILKEASESSKKEMLQSYAKIYWKNMFWITHPQESKIYKSLQKTNTSEKSLLFPLYCDNGGFEEPLDSGGYKFFRNAESFSVGSNQCAILDTPISWIELGAGDIDNFKRMDISELDVFFPNQLPVVYRGNNSLRLNSPNSHLSGECILADNGMDKFSKEFPLSLQQGSWPDEIYITYALVLEAPSDHDDQYPFFSARVVNSEGMAVSDVICIDSGDPSLIVEDTGHECQHYEPVGFKPWACEFVTLDHSLLEPGEVLSLEIVMTDCGRGAHSGYAYIDDLCIQSSITNEYTYEYSDCSNGNYSITLNAEDNGFNASYVWKLFETSVRGSILNEDIIDADPSNSNPDPVEIQVGQTVVFDLDVDKNYFILYDLSANDCNNSQMEQRLALEPSFTAILEDLHFEDENGNDEEVFCDGEKVYINAMTSDNITHHYIVVNRRPIGSTEPWENLVNLLEINDPNFDLSTWLSGLGHSLPPGYEYSVKLAVQNECDPWTEMIRNFKVYANEVNAQFHFEDNNQNIPEEFCSFEQVFLNGSASEGEDRYVLEVSRAIIGDINFIFVTSGSAETQINTINFSQWMLGQTTPLEGGFVYKVVLKVRNECSSWAESIRYFIYNNCCAPPTNLSCTNINGNTFLTWNGFDPDATGFLLFIDPTSACCGNADDTTPSGMFVPTNQISLRSIRAECFEWRVITLCSDGSSSELSEPACYNSFTGCLKSTTLTDATKIKQRRLLKPVISPNPGSDHFNIELQIPTEDYIHIKIYDTGGQLIQDFGKEKVEAGFFQKQWQPAPHLANGVYFVHIQTANGIIQEKVVIAK